MKREFTNKIRFVLDELIPPLIRDSRWFMWPFFVAAYGRFSVSTVMNFKAKAYQMTDEEYSNFYASLGNSVSRRRVTDLNDASIEFIVNNARARKNELNSVLDVGAGNGHLLKKILQEVPLKRLAGTDAVEVASDSSRDFEFKRGLLPNLPYGNKEFDLVTCTHVIEHVLDVDGSVDELIRVARKLIIVVVPRQRYYFYTLDEHLNFFPQIEPLAKKFAPHKVTTHLLDGDWALLVELTDGTTQ